MPWLAGRVTLVLTSWGLQVGKWEEGKLESLSLELLRKFIGVVRCVLPLCVSFSESAPATECRPDRPALARCAGR